MLKNTYSVWPAIFFAGVWLAAFVFTPVIHGRDSVVVFNEIHYHPPGDEPALEWIEVHNQMAVDVELSAWRIDGGIQFDFDLDTVIPGGGYLVIARDPAALEQATGFSGALGPFTGALANGGEEIILYNHNRLQPNAELDGRRIMDRLDYLDKAPWPVAPDGSGMTLAKRDPDSGSKQPANWTWSEQSGGTPGIENFPSPDDVPLDIVRQLEVDASWRYNETGAKFDANLAHWAKTRHAVGEDWSEGPGALAFESKLNDIIGTSLNQPTQNQPYVTTHYFETEIDIAADVVDRIAHIGIEHLIDDGAIFYVNGDEVFRYNMPSGEVNFATLASSGTEAEWIAVEKLSASSLVNGSNRISVEVHQSSVGSSDVAFGLRLDVAVGPPAAGGADYSSLHLNEVSAADGESPLMIELLNGGDQSLQLDGIVVSISGDSEREFAIPAGTTLDSGGFFVIDGQWLEPPLIASDQDRVFVFSPGGGRVIDARQASTSLRGRVADGDFAGSWQRPDNATFGAENSFALEEAIVINEIFYKAYPERGFSDIHPELGDAKVLPLASEWRYHENVSGEGLASGWAGDNHADWPVGMALLGREPTALEEPIRTELSFSRPQVTYYFETDFIFAGDTSAGLTLRHLIDDGAVFYINGVEIARFNMPAGLVTPETLADPSVGNAESVRATIADANLVEGNNRLSVEVHQSNVGSSDIIFGVEVLGKTIVTPGIPGQPFNEPTEEWIELFNRGTVAVDLSDWSLENGVEFIFPAGTTLNAGGYLVVADDAAALSSKYPALNIAGSFMGGLSNKGERITLRDASGNPADEVEYADSGRWPTYPDGGGSSLELIEATADNTKPETWAASDETNKSEWKTFTYRGTAENDRMGNNVFHEFLLGLLDAGELLLDDVSVIESPDGAAIEFIQNGTFENDIPGNLAQNWRAVGTHGSHGRTIVVADPDNPSNLCLHVVSTGATGDKHNKIETTFANRERVVVGNEYQISFRAKWLAGSNQVNTRLYFNYLQQTTLISAPDEWQRWGTPGSENSTRIENLGPTYSSLQHSPSVPTENEPVTVSISAQDHDGVTALTLFYAIEEEEFTELPMTRSNRNTYTATIPGLDSNTIVQFYVEGTDTMGASSQFPPGGAASRALIKSDDGRAILGDVHNLRIIMLDDDRTFLFRNTNRMSNDRLGATVVYDEQTVFHNVGVRLKGSAFGRYNQQHYGFNLEFDPDHLFRGVHRTISIERSPPLKEMLAKHLLTQGGGGIFSAYEDVGRVIAPTERESSPCLFSMARHSAEYWDGQFGSNSGDGTLFNHELLYNPNGSSGGTEGLKINNPYNHTGGRYDFIDRGDNAEPYRFGFQIRSNRDRDDYSAIIGASKALELSGQAMEDAAVKFIDIDQWARAFAALSLVGNDDTYTRVWEHNLRYYQKPTDGRLIVLPWDLDRGFQLAATAPAIGGNNVGKLLKRPLNQRLFDSHAQDMIETTFNRDYATRWANHYRTLTGSSYASEARYIGSRADFITGRLPDESNLEITSNGGVDFSVETSTTSIQGTGWINIRSIRRPDGSDYSLSWLDTETWEILIPLQTGINLVELEAFDLRGRNVGSDSIRITSTAVSALSPQNIAVSEIHYHPSDPTEAEIAAGFTDADQFEFLELINFSGGPIDVSGARFTDGIAFEFPSPAASVAAGERILLVADEAAFRFRYGDATANLITGSYTGNLRNSGEMLRLEDKTGTIVLEFDYNDNHPWPDSADGTGPSLVFVAPKSLSKHDAGINWRQSTTDNGNPGASDRIPFEGAAIGTTLLNYALQDPATQPFFTVHNGNLAIAFTRVLGADDAVITLESSSDLDSWEPVSAANFVERRNSATGNAISIDSETLVFLILESSSHYLRLKVQNLRGE
ncbi:MAG: hypothetical protein ACI9R3_001256 [Verrucomicrobiales bacterium]|jgi:hypothetical protein